MAACFVFAVVVFVAVVWLSFVIVVVVVVVWLSFVIVVSFPFVVVFVHG